MIGRTALCNPGSRFSRGRNIGVGLSVRRVVGLSSMEVKAMRMAIAICLLASLAACAPGYWGPGEYYETEGGCRNSAYCLAPCMDGQTSGQNLCYEVP